MSKRTAVTVLLLVVAILAYAATQLIPPAGSLDRLVFDRQGERWFAFVGLLIRVPVVVIALVVFTRPLEALLIHLTGCQAGTLENHKYRVVVWYLAIETITLLTFM